MAERSVGVCLTPFTCWSLSIEVLERRSRVIPNVSLLGHGEGRLSHIPLETASNWFRPASHFFRSAVLVGGWQLTETRFLWWRSRVRGVMPASVADPLQLVLRTALTGKKSGYGCNDEDDKVADQLEDRLAASAKRVLLTTIEYEPAPKQQVLALDSLKSKYTVLNATSQSSKMGSLNGMDSIFFSIMVPFCIW